MIIDDFVHHARKRVLVQFHQHLTKPGIITFLFREAAETPVKELHFHLGIARQLLLELQHVIVVAEERLERHRIAKAKAAETELAS